MPQVREYCPRQILPSLLHCTWSKKTNGEEEEERKKKRNQQTKLIRELSQSRIFSVNIYSSEGETFWFFLLYSSFGSWENEYKRRKSIWKIVSALFFFHFFFSWFFKYNIDLYKIHKLFLTIQKWIDQKALLNFISTHFLKAHLLFLFIYSFFSFLSTVFNTQCCFIVVRFSPPGQKPDCAQMDPEVQDASQSCQPLCFCFVFFFSEPEWWVTSAVCHVTS